MIVVDASVLTKLFFDETGSDAAAEILDAKQGVLVAPALARVEVANAIVRHMREGKLSQAEAQTACAAWEQMLRDGVVTLTADAELIEHAVQLAMQICHTVPDCLYLALAIELDAAVITADGRFFVPYQPSTQSDTVRVAVHQMKQMAERPGLLHQVERRHLPNRSLGRFSERLRKLAGKMLVLSARPESHDHPIEYRWVRGNIHRGTVFSRTVNMATSLHVRRLGRSASTLCPALKMYLVTSAGARPRIVGALVIVQPFHSAAAPHTEGPETAIGRAFLVGQRPSKQVGGNTIGKVRDTKVLAVDEQLNAWTLIRATQKSLCGGSE